MPLPLSCAPSVRQTEPGESSRSVLCSMPEMGICKDARWEEAALELKLQNAELLQNLCSDLLSGDCISGWASGFLFVSGPDSPSARAIKTFLLIAQRGCSCYLLCSVSLITWSNTDLLTDKLQDSYLHSTWRVLQDLAMKLRYKWECKSHVGRTTESQ